MPHRKTVGALARTMIAIRTSHLAALGSVVTVVSCGYDGPMIIVQELKARLDDPKQKLTVVDVRPTADFAKGHVPEAINIPLPSLAGQTTAIAAMEGELAVICTCGRSALAAVKQLQSSGIPAILVEGGYKKWNAAGFPLARSNE